MSLTFQLIIFNPNPKGLSTSLNHMETSRTPGGQNAILRFDKMRLHVAIILFFMIGQIVGSSGGIHFLAEFIVTAVGLLLGGAATVSTVGLQCWLYFSGLSSVGKLHWYNAIAIYEHLVGVSNYALHRILGVLPFPCCSVYKCPLQEQWNRFWATHFLFYRDINTVGRGPKK